MSKVFERYFDGNDVNYGKASMMRDIECHRLAGSELAILIDDLESRGMLLDKPFAPKPKEYWDASYMSWLSKGHLSDHFSRGYLEHCGEVAEYVYGRTQRERQQKITKAVAVWGLIVLAVAVIVLICRYFASRAEMGLNALPQEVETERVEEAAACEEEGFPQECIPQEGLAGLALEGWPQSESQIQT